MTSPPSFENGFSFLLAGDFDQTLSFNDSGYVLCELLGIKGFEEKVSGLVRRCHSRMGQNPDGLAHVSPNPNTLRRKRNTGQRFEPATRSVTEMPSAA